jgi:ABC-type amino acid transport substrate-binding protein
MVMYLLASNFASNYRLLKRWFSSLATVLYFAGLFLGGLLLVGQSLSAVAEPLQFASPLIEPGQGPRMEDGYRKFHEQIMAEVKLETELTFLPIYEAQARLTRREAAGLLGGICGVKRQAPVIYSKAYVSLPRHLITTDGTLPLTRIEQLQGKRLGLVKRYYYDLPSASELKSMGIDVHYIEAEVNAVAMLVAGRVDVILAPALVAEKIGAEISSDVTLRYTQEPFSVQHLCYVLPQTALGKVVAQRINGAIISLYQSEVLHKFISPPFRPPQPQALGLAGKP